MPTYQVEMNAETHSQLERPGLTYLTRAEAMRAMSTVLRAHGRAFTVDEEPGIVTYRNERGGALATIRAVEA